MTTANLGRCAVIRLLAEDRPTAMTAPDKQQSTSVWERTIGYGTDDRLHSTWQGGRWLQQQGGGIVVVRGGGIELWLWQEGAIAVIVASYYINLIGVISLFVSYWPPPTTRDAILATIVAGERARIRLNIEVNIN
jgi:hypothetical protein